jgi:hypothetical protein
LTSERRRLAADPAVSERVLSIAVRASAATQGPWGICGPGGSHGRSGRRRTGPRPGRWLCQMVEDAASALDPETLGLKDSEG